MIVVDTGVVVKLVLRSAESEAVARLFESEPLWVAPRLVRSEVMSVLSQVAPHARLGPATQLVAFDVAMDAYHDASLEAEPQRVLELTSTSGCSSYDCEYVAIAQELGCRLATYDRKVIRRFPGVASTPEAILAGRA